MKHLCRPLDHNTIVSSWMKRVDCIVIQNDLPSGDTVACFFALEMSNQLMLLIFHVWCSNKNTRRPLSGFWLKINALMLPAIIDEFHWYVYAPNDFQRATLQAWRQTQNDQLNSNLRQQSWAWPLVWINKNKKFWFPSVFYHFTPPNSCVRLPTAGIFYTSNYGIVPL